MSRTAETFVHAQDRKTTSCTACVQVVAVPFLKYGQRLQRNSEQEGKDSKTVLRLVEPELQGPACSAAGVVVLGTAAVRKACYADTNPLSLCGRGMRMQ